MSINTVASFQCGAFRGSHYGTSRKPLDLRGSHYNLRGGHKGTHKLQTSLAVYDYGFQVLKALKLKELSSLNMMVCNMPQLMLILGSH